MSNTPTNLDSLPPTTATEKPETKPAAVTSSASTPSAATPAQPKPAVKIQNTTKPMKEPSTFKSSPINSAWADEIVTSFGLSGQLAKDVATELTTELSEAISSKFTRPKLAKLVRAAVTKAIQ